MGLTKSSVGIGVADNKKKKGKTEESKFTVALAGNPNVGKSTVFNALTGMDQHTGNWPGKTVTNASGICHDKRGGKTYKLVDIPGTYSLMAHSAEEEVARDFICFSPHDVNVVVCDATCFERNLNLVLQIMEVSPRTVVCLNLLDEAKKKKININAELISERLGVRVVGVVARKKKTLQRLLDALDEITSEGEEVRERVYRVKYREEIENAISVIAPMIEERMGEALDPRWVALRLIEGGNAESALHAIASFAAEDGLFDAELCEALEGERKKLEQAGLCGDKLCESIVTSFVESAEKICDGAVVCEADGYSSLDRRLDRIFTSRLTGYPIMLAILGLILWLTVVGANYVSDALSGVLFGLQKILSNIFLYFGAPDWLHGIVVLGAYRVLAWVVSVMLPPMAIFFPLFTILEDAGYLPRVAYDLDRPFKKCNACGKQALTMCMGFGCNAAGVVGCRIIDSPRERLLAILTNSFVPCNGKFPMLISLVTIFFIGAYSGWGASLFSALAILALIFLGVCTTLLVTRFLSKTLLRGVPSSFTLELPPYRMPQFTKVVVRSVFDRTLFVLGRAAAVAAPAGALIWLMANVSVGDESVLSFVAAALDPFARLMGLDGVILLSFVLGFPANEIVIPITVMAYTAERTLAELQGLAEMKEIFVANGWSWITAESVIIFTLFHWPCSTTLMTVKRETGDIRLTLLAALLPTAVGMIVCIIFANIARLFV